jgi:hypothetical protein
MFPIAWIAAGAAAMYFFDPQDGDRRRALMRDKLASWRHQADDLLETAEGKAEHVRNRAKGLMHETRSMVREVKGDAPAGADMTRSDESTSDTAKDSGTGENTSANTGAVTSIYDHRAA